jgi:phosphatidylserine/phosphatidylglycerophosphate/cardiolipin synthase-like enzyme
MHNKFCVIDEQTVWTGSWNPTKTKQANNVVIVQSKVLAANYLEEFEELPGGYRRVRHPRVSYNNKLIENYFCPDDDCKEHVIEQLAGAKQSIRFMLSWITDEDIIATLNRRSKDIDVQGILDNGAYDESFAALPFAKEGDVHHKVFVIDGNTVITGSYNPTKSGDSRNDENILIIHDVAVAKEFLDEYAYLIS